MSFPSATPSQINYWLASSKARLAQSADRHANGFYQQNGTPLRKICVDESHDYAELGGALVLNGNPIDEARTAFAEAARCVLKCFTTAYDRDDPDYRSLHIGEWVTVNELALIRGANWALIAADFDLAADLAYRFRPNENQRSSPDLAGYALALRLLLLDLPEQAYNHLHPVIDQYLTQKREHTFQSEYFSLCIALAGIIHKDAEAFNQGLAVQTAYYERDDRQQEGRLTRPAGYICNHAVALANLGTHVGLPLTHKYSLMPLALLLTTH